MHGIRALFPECIVGHVFDSANNENYVYMAYKRANIVFGSPVKLIVNDGIFY